MEQIFQQKFSVVKTLFIQALLFKEEDLHLFTDNVVPEKNDENIMDG